MIESMLQHFDIRRFLLILVIVISSMDFSFGQVDLIDDLPVDQSEEPVEESFTNTKEFRAVMGGVAGFWGGVFSMGSIYLLMVFAKRVFNPEEEEKK